jgi:tetratricopeptide (TPR) repeat protein
MRTLLRAAALRESAQFAWLQGNYEDSRARWHESLEIGRARNDAGAIGSSLLGLGQVALAEKDPVLAMSCFEQSLALARESRDESMTLISLNNLGETHRIHGQIDQAQLLYQEALAISRRRDLPNWTAIALLNLSTIAVSGRDYVSAREHIIEAAQLANKIDSHSLWNHIMDVIVALAFANGDANQAARMWGASEVLHERSGERRFVTDQQFIAPFVARTRKSLGNDFENAFAAGKALSRGDAMREGLAWLTGDVSAKPVLSRRRMKDKREKLI